MFKRDRSRVGDEEGPCEYSCLNHSCGGWPGELPWLLRLGNDMWKAGMGDYDATTYEYARRPYNNHLPFLYINPTKTVGIFIVPR